jgi:ADP-heptose:LPS heptosyltransferase
MKIGIYRSCGIGDFVQMTPLLRQIRADLPAARVTLFTSGNVAEMLEGCPWIDAGVTFPPEQLRGRWGVWGGLTQWRRVARDNPWDIFLNVEPRWRRSLFFPLVRARRRGGFQTEGWKPLRLFDEFILQRRAGGDRGHSSAHLLTLWEKLTGQRDRGFGYDLSYLGRGVPSPPELPPRAVCLVPGAGNFFSPGEGKRWPLANWQALAAGLREAGWVPVWLGSAEDARHFPLTSTELNLMGRLNLRQSCAAIAASRALVANDSGLFHAAVGLGTAVVGLFGPTNPQNTGPFRASSSLVFKAGWGRVDSALLDLEHDGEAQRALAAAQPMALLSAEEVCREVPRFLNALNR